MFTGTEATGTDFDNSEIASPVCEWDRRETRESRGGRGGLRQSKLRKPVRLLQEVFYARQVMGSGAGMITDAFMLCTTYYGLNLDICSARTLCLAGSRWQQARLRRLYRRAGSTFSREGQSWAILN